MRRIFIVLLCLSACSSHYVKRSQASDQKIDQLNLASVQFFSPDENAAKLDDFSIKDQKFSCETPLHFWAELLSLAHEKELRECLNSIHEGVGHYLFIPKAKPFLEIDPLEKGTPECLKKVLPRLPLPREIYVLGKRETEANWDAYEFSFDTRANQVADAELRVPRFQVQIRFPVSRPLENFQDLHLWILTRALSLFETQGGFVASSVPELTFHQCFRNDPLIQDKKTGKIPAIFWP